MVGPIPSANSLTLTLKSFAKMKCPNSWIKIINPKKRTATRIGHALLQTAEKATRKFNFILSPYMAFNKVSCGSVRFKNVGKRIIIL